jgi:dienelactone hydrolase
MTETANFTSRGQSISAELYTPASITTNGLITIAYGSDGLFDYPPDRLWATMIRGYAEALAQRGFVVLIPNYLAATKTESGPSVSNLIPKYRDFWQEAVSDAIDHGKTLPGVDTTRVGLLGFSLGGHLCLRVRAKAQVLVEFFAPVLDGIGPPGKLTHAQIHHGEADDFPGTGFPNAISIENTLKAEGASPELCRYPGAGHGFVGSDPKNTEARELSMKRTIAFFDSYL